jgi:two-component sensor histidine kinase
VSIKRVWAGDRLERRKDSSYNFPGSFRVKLTFAASTGGSVAKLVSATEVRLNIENEKLRQLLAQAGIDAAEHKVMEGLQRLLLEELHHRIKNVLATVIAIVSQSLKNADSVEHGREAIESRLLALGRVHDLLLKTNWTSATLESIVKNAN